MINRMSSVRDLNAKLSENLSRRNIVESSYKRTIRKSTKPLLLFLIVKTSYIILLHAPSTFRLAFRRC